MDLIYRFDKILLKKINHKINVSFDGFCFHKDGQQLEYELEINDNSASFSKIVLLRPDVVKEYENYQVDQRCGFRILSELQAGEELEEVALYAIADHQKILLKKINKSELDNYISDDNIEYNVDNIHFDQQRNLFSVSGWAFSNDDGLHLDFKIVDNRKRNIKYDINLKNREDLYFLKMVKYKQKRCGFEISFYGNKRNAYYMIISDGNENHEIELYKRNITFSSIIRKCMSLIIKDSSMNEPESEKEEQLHAVPVDEGIYEEFYHQNKVTSEELAIQKVHQFKYSPLISIVVPVFNTPLNFLREMIESVLNQSYQNFELCIADGSTDETVMEEIQKYASQDRRIVYCKLEKNFGIAGNTNEALKLANGDYIGLFDHDDLLTLDCLYEIVDSLQDKEHDIIYTDEDKIDETSTYFFGPHFKPNFNKTLLCSYNYITHFFVVKKEIVDKIGNFRSEFDGSQDYDFIFRCVETAKSVYHIPKVLYHWRVHQFSTAGNPESKLYCYEAGKRAIESHYTRFNIQSHVEIIDRWIAYHPTFELTSFPLISVIIRHDGETASLEKCIESLYKLNTYKKIEIIVVAKNSKKIQSHLDDSCHIIDGNVDHIPAAFNLGASQANGEYLLFLDSSCSLTEKNSLTELLGIYSTNNIGIAGSKIMDKDEMIQHAGIMLGIGREVGYPFIGLGKDEYGYMTKARVNSEYAAVSYLGMFIKKQLFHQLHQFDERYGSSMFDVDLCHQAFEKGNLIVYNAFSIWQHNDKIITNKPDVELYKNKWKEIKDPYYESNINILADIFHID